MSDILLEATEMPIFFNEDYNKCESCSIETPLKLLVVDDDEDFHKILSQKLKHQNFEIDFALDSYQALHRLKWKRPDIILLDFHLPGIDGVQFAHVLKSKSEFESIPLIILSRNNQIAVDSLLELKVIDDFEFKPIDSARLKRKIEKILLDL